MENKLVTTSPHVAGNKTTKGIMLDVIIALLPSALCGVFLYGAYAFALILVSVATCVLAEALYCKIVKKPLTVFDLSAVVTGLILALNMPPYVPIYVVIISGVFAIMLVKMLFGGLGRNFANPAATGRIFALIAWSSVMTKFYNPITYQGISDFFFYPAANAVDAVAGATPLAAIASGGEVSVLNAFLGNVAGSLGETSALAILLGGIYLCARKVINPTLPLLIVGSYVTFAVLLGESAINALTSVLCGGLLFGAVFMATDYSSSPNTKTGRLVYALLIALLCALIRTKGAYPEGMSFAILLGNIIAPILDKYFIPKAFGEGKDVKEIAVTVLSGLSMLAFLAITVLTVGGVL